MRLPRGGLKRCQGLDEGLGVRVPRSLHHHHVAGLYGPGEPRREADGIIRVTAAASRRKGVEEGFHQRPGGEHQVDPSRLDRFRQAGMEVAGVRAQPETPAVLCRATLA